MSFEKLCLEPFLPPVFLLKWLPLFKNTCNPITPLPHEVFVIIRQQISHVLISISGRQPGLACISIVLTEHVLTEPLTFNLSGKKNWSTLTRCNWLGSFKLSWIPSHRGRKDKKGQPSIDNNWDEGFFKDSACHIFNNLLPQLEYVAR